MHCFCEIGALLLYLQRRLYDLLMQHLVAVGEVIHPGAENHCVLVHVDAHVTLLGHQLDDRLSVLRLLEHLVRLEELLVVLNSQEVVQADG